MRMWHVDLLPVLPDKQFKGQLRELVAIMRDWRDKGTTNHVLINRVMEYSKAELTAYFELYAKYYEKRYGKKLDKYLKEFSEFAKDSTPGRLYHIAGVLYPQWHNHAYLRICMANLYEKYLGVGKSKLTDEEWLRLCEAYKALLQEEYRL